MSQCFLLGSHSGFRVPIASCSHVRLSGRNAMRTVASPLSGTLMAMSCIPRSRNHTEKDPTFRLRARPDLRRRRSIDKPAICRPLRAWLSLYEEVLKGFEDLADTPHASCDRQRTELPRSERQSEPA